MSRCFPFPPPGYEKKPRPEEDLLKEEKRREKKHKKEKVKEKREGKDKKERDKSNGKHTEKKERREKHRDQKGKDRDKKKDREKNKSKDKEKSSVPEDASVSGQPETRSMEKIYTKEDLPTEKSHGPVAKKFALQFQSQNGQNHIEQRLARESEESKFVQELGRRIRDEEMAMGSHPVEKSSGADCRVSQETHRVAITVRDPQNMAEDKEKNKERRVNNRKVEGQGLHDEPRSHGNTIVQNVAGSIERIGGMPGAVQKATERSIEGKDKLYSERSIEGKDKLSKEKGDVKQGEKRKEKDKKEKKSHGKDKGREKEKKKEEKTKERTRDKNNEPVRSKELFRNEFSGFNNNIPCHLSADDYKNVRTAENLKKRKDVETNGFLHEHEARPSKQPRFNSRHLSENGRKLEACLAPGLLASDKQWVSAKDGVDDRQRGVNGTIEAPSLRISKEKGTLASTRSDQLNEVLKDPPQAGQYVEALRKLPDANQFVGASKQQCQANQIAESSKKPLHPDLKYLSQVLSVPKMEEWSEADDQEWLFSSKGPPPKEPDVGTSRDGRQPRVWSEALHIESADIYALPYVIPH